MKRHQPTRAVVYSVAIALFCALLGFTLHATADTEGYKEATSVPSAYRATLDGGDSIATDSAITTGTVTRSEVTGTSTIKVCAGNPTIRVSARLSVTGATCAVAVILYQSDATGNLTCVGVRTQTATATAYRETLDADALFIANTLYFDTEGYSHYEVRAADPSASATVSLWVGVYGLERQ